MPAVYEEIDGFRCYAPKVALDYADYPSDGFDVTAEVEARSFWCRARNRVLRYVLERFTDRTRPLDVLEIGCGIGGVIQELQHIQNFRLTGSEIYLQGLRFARTRLPLVDFIQLDATDSPFKGQFDVVGAFDVLEHIDDDELVMRQVASALKSNGLFVVTVPQYTWMWSRLDEVVLHKRRYRRRELLSKLRAAGFDIVYTTSFVTTLFPFLAAVRLRDRPQPSVEGCRADFESRVTLPAVVNVVFDWVSRFDELLLKLGLTLPFGGSLLTVARRSQPPS